MSQTCKWLICALSCVLADPDMCVYLVQEELDVVKAKLQKAEKARDAAKGVDEKEYEDQRQEVERLSARANALDGRIAAEKPAGKYPQFLTNSRRAIADVLIVCVCVCPSLSLLLYRVLVVRLSLNFRRRSFW